MGKLFEILDLISTVFEWFFNFLETVWKIITTTFTVAMTIFADVPPVLMMFFSLFIVLSLAFFVWRLIP